MCMAEMIILLCARDADIIGVPCSFVGILASGYLKNINTKLTWENCFLDWLGNMTLNTGPPVPVWLTV